MKHKFIIVDENVAERACAAITRLGDCAERHEVIIRPHKSSRSLAQNALFHDWMTEFSQKFAESTGKFITSKNWKGYFKEMFLGYEVMEVNGKTITELRHTADLKVKPFAEFLTKIDHYCGSEFEIYLYHPSDFDKTMGIRRKK